MIINNNQYIVDNKEMCIYLNELSTRLFMQVLCFINKTFYANAIFQAFISSTFFITFTSVHVSI